MAEKYFAKFPLVYYNNYLAVNITERAVITNDAFNNPYLLNAYDIKDEARPDQFADNYYNDQFMDWILYLGNKTTDPYYGWYMNDRDLHNFMKAKYKVDISILKSKVAFYRNNWYEKDVRISISEYKALPTRLYRYWEPYYENNNRIVGYHRAKEDWIINTNSLRRYTANSSSFSNFITNEVVKIKFDATHSGAGQVVIANSSSITLQHISGTSMANSVVTISGSSTITGKESLATAAFSTAVNIVDNLAPEEVIYWSPVTIYDSEKEKNEQKKSINVLDSRYAMRISNELTKILK